LTTTPVAVGIKAAPKNSKLHKRGMIYTKLDMNPIGAAKIKARVPKAAQSLMAVKTFLPL